MMNCKEYHIIYEETVGGAVLDWLTVALSIDHARECFKRECSLYNKIIAIY